LDTFLTKAAAERYVEGALRNGANVRFIALYTAPPQCEWHGLTDEEIEDAGKLSVEAKLKEKNG
jgi:hypothetical protein